ncbi:MAG: NAD(P)/FAD-dependent oxidoreductase [Cyclobacteriaceae bacterium]|nr:NAD(P)/FAD-dependent oxidoreductase [Cyclobacteriaceae bacterium]MCH8517279.1 NAD(P)/FAD-dependent oxidoreductase [Cyclobacteriaceae bacterium]
MHYPCVVVGGGLAGLVAAHLLRDQGKEVLLIEKKQYPFHRVCGEYISEEVRPFLEACGLFPNEYNPPKIRQFRLYDTEGGYADQKLDTGGFGISRYALDYYWKQLLEEKGGLCWDGETVESVQFGDNRFLIETKMHGNITTDVVIAAHGKRSKLDRQLDRSFMNQPAPFVGVKYHIRTKNFPSDRIALYNFKGGYCGLSEIEDGKFNLCYLAEKGCLTETGSIQNMEEKYVKSNPALAYIYENSDFLMDKPITINEVSFARKEAVENHLLMAGDSAGLITPLCGNGMAMAIRAGAMAAFHANRFLEHEIDRSAMETDYAKTWNEEFRTRLWVGRNSQKLFGKKLPSQFAVGLLKYLPKIGNNIIEKTHGDRFQFSASIGVSKL